MSTYNFKEAKRKYRELCRKENSIWIYIQDWYLDAVTEKEDDWQVILVEENGEIQAAFPFGYQKRHGLYYIEAPWQCSRMGLWIREENSKGKLSDLLRLDHYVNEVMDKLPKFDVFRIPFTSDFTNWQPFYWAGFTETTHYSMEILPSEGQDYLPKVSKSRRKRIAKGDSYIVEANCISVDEYWDFLVTSFRSKGMQLTYGEKKFKKLISVLLEHQACVIWSVKNKAGDIVAEEILIESSNICFNQFGSQIKGSDTSAKSVAVYQAIQYTLDKGKTFDFEGSMIRGVCEFDASFNPEWRPYYIITKHSRRYELLNCIVTFGQKLFRRDNN